MMISVYSRSSSLSSSDCRQLRGAAQAAERVLDLVGKPADHVAGQDLLGDQPLFATDAQMAIDVLQFDDREAAALFVDHRRDRAVDRDVAAVSRQDHAALGDRRTDGRRAHQVDDRLAMAFHPRVGRFADHVLGTDREQHLRQLVDVVDAEIGIEDQDGGGQVV